MAAIEPAERPRALDGDCDDGGAGFGRGDLGRPRGGSLHDFGFRHQHLDVVAAAAVRRADGGAAPDRPVSAGPATNASSPTNSNALAPNSTAPICSSPASRRSSSPGSGRDARTARRGRIRRWCPRRATRAACLAFSAWLEPSAIARKAEEAVDKLLQRGEAFSLDRRGPQRPAFRDFRPRDRRQCGDAHSRHFRRPAAARQAARKPRAQRWPRWRRCASCSTRTPNPGLDPRAATGASSGSTRPMRARSRRSRSRRRRSRSASNCSTLGARARARRALAASGGRWRARAPAIVAGERRIVRGLSKSRPRRARPASRSISPRSRALRSEMERHIGAYRGMLDQLSTAVAIFDRSKRLIFYNAAYRQIWSLDPAFLDQRPTDGEILDRLRAKRQLPEQADFRKLEGADAGRLSGDRADRDGLASARRARAAGGRRARIRRAASPISSTTRRRASRSPPRSMR